MPLVERHCQDASNYNQEDGSGFCDIKQAQQLFVFTGKYFN
jgi:hypothetical protein